MPLARSLRELLAIRQHNAAYLRGIPGCLGTAVGFRYNERRGRFEGEETRDHKPAVLVFVAEKIPLAALTREHLVPTKFRGPRGLECFSDVIVGRPPQPVSVEPPTSGINAGLLHALHHTDVGVIGGLPIRGPASDGTAGAVVRRGDELGVLTNYHVAGFEGSEVLRLGAVYERLGRTTRSLFAAPHTPGDPDDLESFAPDANPYLHRVDLGLVALAPAAAEAAKQGVFGLTQPLGEPFAFDIDARDFAPIGRHVVGVGQKLGRQEGRIIAYGYEWRASLTSDTWYATDYLIRSEGDLPFAASGDSGKLVVTNDLERRPIALLWGGETHAYGNVPAQVTCAYATEIGLVSRLLGGVSFDWQSVTCER
ncbi:hypothetical protein ASA1KI_08500 [Opitutales bacterium ASA1]|uniref:hypothetical protein n=1 Tax=Congregicoccus parvus TaxID=3081749 RepID=UPI002B2C2518|nr:hypothetical protein ASA1KI_08500 [Opitutales bacterium ASA1]